MAKTITLNTDWGAPGEQLTGQEVQDFIKSQLRTLFAKNIDYDANINNLINHTDPNIRLNQLDNLVSASTFESVSKQKSKLYNVLDDDNVSLGKLIMFSNGSNCLAQVLFSFHSQIVNNVLTPSASPTILYRFYAKTQIGEINANTWSPWTNMINQQIDDALVSIRENIAPTVYEDELDTMINAQLVDFVALTHRSSVYNVLSREGANVGKMMLFSDAMRHTIVQYLFSFYTPSCPPGGKAHSQRMCPMYRCWSTDNVHGPSMHWSEWRYVWADELQEYLSTMPGATSLLLNNSIVQTLGNNTDKIISQSIITNALNAIVDYLGLTLTQNINNTFNVSGKITSTKIEETSIPKAGLTQAIGTDSSKVISQSAVTSALQALGGYLGLTITQGTNDTFQISGTVPSSRLQSTSTNISGKTGNSDTSTMSQYAITRMFKAICDKANIAYTENALTGEIELQ